MAEFRDVSISATKELTKAEKQSQGIFFTPKTARNTLFEVLKKLKVKPKKILEPSFGSGEFLEDAYEKYPDAEITGIELNPGLFGHTTRTNVHNMDFLEYRGEHDLIIGNPPYFLIPSSATTKICQTGRPNMFVQFLYKAIHENLTTKGYLAFVLPTSLLNSVYYEPMRKYLFENTCVVAVEKLDGNYIDTQQATFLLVVQKGKKKSKYFLERNGNKYLTLNPEEMTKLLRGSSTLTELGFEVSTGKVVWNQEKEKMSDEGTLLIYSSNLKKGELVLHTPIKAPKKQYITGFGKDALSGESILINRGYGNTTYRLDCVLVDLPEYYAENHVNVVRPVTEHAKTIVKKVYDSLNENKTADFIRMFAGNNALSKSEIEGCVPIWLD